MDTVEVKKAGEDLVKDGRDSAVESIERASLHAVLSDIGRAGSEG